MYVNGKNVKQPTYVIQNADLVDNSVLPIRVGKRTRKFALLHCPLCLTSSVGDT